MTGKIEDLIITARLDTRGQSAAWAILCAERAVEELEPGQVLEVRINDPQLAVDLPRVLHRRGEALLATHPAGDGLRLYVRRGTNIRTSNLQP